jgi:4-amino-4-deoxychorismate lyase
MSTILINGDMTDRLPASDRGLQYGDGLFETLAVVDGRPQLWEAHMQRLEEGGRRLGIAIPDTETLWSEALPLCREASRAVLKIIITRGSGGRGYRPAETMQATRILSLHPWPDYPPEHVSHGVWIRSCHTTLGMQPALAGIKHLNRLEQVLARREWNDPEIVEGVMCDPYGMVIEATISNLFFVRGDKVVTPELSGCGVAGIMRRQVLETCRSLSLVTLEQGLTVEAAKASDEIFLTNSLIGVWPVRRWDDTKYPVQGETTATIINHLNEQLAVCK